MTALEPEVATTVRVLPMRAHITYRITNEQDTSNPLLDPGAGRSMGPEPFWLNILGFLERSRANNILNAPHYPFQNHESVPAETYL